MEIYVEIFRLKALCSLTGAITFYAEDGGSVFLQNTCTHLQVYNVS